MGETRFSPTGEKERKRDKSRRGAAAAVSRLISIVFFLAMAGIIAAAVLTGTRGVSPNNRFRFHMFTVMTGSMRPEIPIDSLVIVKAVDAGEINVGDDITYIRKDQNIITHRVIEVLENYTDQGKRGFRTQGLTNSYPDEEIVFAGNVLGKVVFHNAVMGKILAWLRSHVWFSIGFILALLALGAVLRYLDNEKKRESLSHGKPFR